MVILTSITCSTCCFVSLVLIEILTKTKKKVASPLSSNHFFAGLVNSFGLILTNVSMSNKDYHSIIEVMNFLVYVSYPAKVLSKSCKPISVIIFTSILTPISYSLTRWISVFLITCWSSGIFNRRDNAKRRFRKEQKDDYNWRFDAADFDLLRWTYIHLSRKTPKTG